MRTVIYIAGPGRTPDHRTVTGIDRYARTANWRLHVIEASSPYPEPEAIVNLWNPDGLIIRHPYKWTAAELRIIRMIPTVYIGYAPGALSRAAIVLHNDAAKTATDAARELLRLDLAEYIYVSDFNAKIRPWDRERMEHFKHQIKVNGRKISVFRDRREELSKFLAKRKHPFGIMAASDRCAIEVMGICEQMGIAIPDDAAVIGVDNDTTPCETARPSLSSVALDYIGCGEMAAQLLDQMMSGKRVSNHEQTYGTLGVVRRASTNRYTRIDHEVSEAVERIRREACRGLTAKAALSGMSCSRRMAEMRFRQVTGMSPLAMIREIKLANAKEMIANGCTSMKAISDFCGYASPAALTALFRSKQGETPTSWKRTSNTSRKHT